MTETTKNNSIKAVAQAGLIAKGIVYVLLGFIAFFAAVNIRKGSEDVSSRSAFSFIEDLPAGTMLLWVLAAGLLCYSVWRLIQTFSRSNGGEETKMAKRFRYFFSALAYLALTYSLVKFIRHQSSSGGDQNQQMAGELMNKPFGPWLVIIAGLIMAAVGIYQIWYGLSEKYKKHVQSYGVHSSSASALVRSGKIGYVARGFVWLLISYMLVQAGVGHNSSEAGNTGDAFKMMESSMGTPIAAAVGLGLVAYGIFCFVRARHDRFT